jgi:hypothetical protein
MANKKLYTCGSGIDLLKDGFKFWAWKREDDLSLSDYRLTVPEEAIVAVNEDTFQVDPTNVTIKYSQVKRLPKKVTAKG